MMIIYNSIFNYGQKQEYIDFEKRNSDTLRRYFVRLCDAEAELGKDIADMDIEELRTALSSLNIRREESRGHVLSLMRGYINWARLNGKTDNDSKIDSITPSSLGSESTITNTMIKNPEHLESILQDGLDYDFYENRSIMIELIVRLLYSGMELSEIQTLEKDGIDSNHVLCADKRFEIDETTAELWEKCVDMTYIEKKNGKSYTAKKPNTEEYSRCYLADSKYLLRPSAGNNPESNRCCSLNLLRRYVALVSEGFNDGRNYPPKNIQSSGIFYKLLQLENTGKEITAEDLAEHLFIKYTGKSDLLVKVRKWRIDFLDWKLAFEH